MLSEQQLLHASRLRSVNMIQGGTADDIRRANARCFSLSSFLGEPESSAFQHDNLSPALAALLAPPTDYAQSKDGRALLTGPSADYASDGECVPGKDALRRARRKGRAATVSDGFGVETPRGFPLRRGEKDNKKSLLSRLSSMIYEDQISTADSGLHRPTITERHCDLKNARLKLFAARSALDEQPAIIDQGLAHLLRPPQLHPSRTHDSPGVFSLHTRDEVERKRLERPNGRLLAVSEDDEKAVQRMMFECRNDMVLTEKLLYDTRFDNKWKERYTTVLLEEEGVRRKKRPENRQGWVVPLRRICDKVGINPSFFTRDKAVTLQEARVRVLRERLAMETAPSEWLKDLHPEATQNTALSHFLRLTLDPRGVQQRVALFQHRLHADRDRVRVYGQYYNNINLGKRMFGPARKQKFVRTILGGIERRFEILDNQVNHIPFRHLASDRMPHKCRNTRIKCRDDTRVVLQSPSYYGSTIIAGSSVAAALSAEETFIHANHVKGAPLFSHFILTQAPLQNTLEDFWRMIWQERVPYIFMLISRKDSSRCAPYWPRNARSPPIVVGDNEMRIENMGVQEHRDVLFRVTYLRIIGAEGEERHVEHWQGNLNNVENVVSPLMILRLARSCSLPVVIHDHLGISRAACLIAAEAAITSLLRGPATKNLVQQAVQWVRSSRPFSVETPMQFVYIHRIVAHFFRDILPPTRAFDVDYRRWLEERAMRMFLDDDREQLPGYRQLSPRIDPDLLRLARRRERPDSRREANDCVGELPLPLEGADVLAARKRLPNKYPAGVRYN